MVEASQQAIGRRQTWKGNIIWFVALVLFFTFSLHIARKSLEFLNLPGKIDSYIAIVLGVILVALCVRYRIGLSDHSRRVFPWSALPIFLFSIWHFLDRFVGAFNFELIKFHFSIGLVEDLQTGVYEYAFQLAMATLAVIVTGYYLMKRSRIFRFLDVTAAVFLTLFNPLLQELAVRQVQAWNGVASVDLLDHFARPVVVREPAKYKNLIYIYLESLERSFADTSRFGDIYAPIAALEKKGLSITGVRQVAGTGWSVAGRAASQCGIPVLTVGLRANRFLRVKTYDRFFPDEVCLGDILSRSGYDLSYLHAVKSNFMQSDQFYKLHGFSVIEGSETYKERYESEYPVGEGKEWYGKEWYISDDLGFKITLNRIRESVKGGKPFAHIFSPITSHFPHGWPTKYCHDNLPNEGYKDLLYAVKCMGFLVTRFYNTLEREGLLENTLVVFASDHLMMGKTANQMRGIDRQNTVIFLDKDILPGQVKRDGSVLDIYPTILELLGYEIQGHRAGLGVSLLSNEQTLAERLGYERLDDSLNRDSALRKKIWGVNG